MPEQDIYTRVNQMATLAAANDDFLNQLCQEVAADQVAFVVPEEEDYVIAAKLAHESYRHLITCLDRALNRMHPDVDKALAERHRVFGAPQTGTPGVCTCGKATTIVPGSTDWRWCQAGEEFAHAHFAELTCNPRGLWSIQHFFQKPMKFAHDHPRSSDFDHSFAVSIGSCGHGGEK